MRAFRDGETKPHFGLVLWPWGGRVWLGRHSFVLILTGERPH